MICPRTAARSKQILPPDFHTALIGSGTTARKQATWLREVKSASVLRPTDRYKNYRTPSEHAAALQ